jgi:hypothetical protein
VAYKQQIKQLEDLLRKNTGKPVPADYDMGTFGQRPQDVAD